MKTYALRLHPDQDLREALDDFSNEYSIRAGVVLTCAGSLKHAILRMADENVIREFDGKFEIVSLVGTLSPDGNHIHMSLADREGKTIGGHLKKGCIIHTTAEIVIAECDGLSFSREFDERTGFDELVINEYN